MSVGLTLRSVRDAAFAWSLQKLEDSYPQSSDSKLSSYGITMFRGKGSVYFVWPLNETLQLLLYQTTEIRLENFGQDLQER